MLRVLGLVVVIALGDSLNPSTIAPALFVASGQQPRRRVLEFTLGVLLVHLLAGLAIAIGPGRLLLSLLRGLDPVVQDLLELLAGAGMLVAASVLWSRRHRLAERDLPDPNPKRKSSAVLGATIIAVELPTAFPYFAAIAATLAAGGGVARQLALLMVYNLLFVAPLLAILVVRLLAAKGADARLTRWRDRLQERWPTVLAALLCVVGSILAALASVGLASR